MKTAAAILLAITSVAIGCSSGGSSDAGCWPIEGTMPGGEVEIGTADDDDHFAPMPASLPFIIGNQSGTFMVVHARMKGLEPGDPIDFLSNRNPRTRFSAIMPDGTRVGDPCGGTIGYVPSADGFVERKHSVNLEYLPYEVGARGFDKMITLIVEVIDADRRYATDEKQIFGMAPMPTRDADGGSVEERDGN